MLKQLSPEQVEQLNDDLMLQVEYHPINIDEELFELSKDKHLKKSFTKPRKKVKKRNYNYISAFILLGLLIFGAYSFFNLIMKERASARVETKVATTKVEQLLKIPDHINLNDKIEQRIRDVFNIIDYDIILKELKIEQDSMELKGVFLAEDTYFKSLKPKLDILYKTSEYISLDSQKKVNIESTVISKGVIPLSDIVYKTNSKEYITDELISTERVSEQLKILLPENSILKLVSSTNEGINRYNYIVNILVKEPAQFFELIEVINHELYSINISYPINMLRTELGIEIEFNLVFNQPK